MTASHDKDAVKHTQVNTASASDKPSVERVRTTRLFKVLNPELFFGPKKLVYIPGTMIFAGIIGYFAYQSYSNNSKTSSNLNGTVASQPRSISYAEKLEKLKKEQAGN
ncbi:hypothetical protein AYI70_g343 [Smittium culicis]|uniref:Uncharacterized protein n=1 Tax=Smittium culicis TaxID=133412 RepID=A0A1R1YH27_9FUNG|nr:hypothetical protein AYI70_g343 [Smittium culicis]